MRRPHHSERHQLQIRRLSNDAEAKGIVVRIQQRTDRTQVFSSMSFGRESCWDTGPQADMALAVSSSPLNSAKPGTNSSTTPAWNSSSPPARSTMVPHPVRSDPRRLPRRRSPRPWPRRHHLGSPPTFNTHRTRHRHQTCLARTGILCPVSLEARDMKMSHPGLSDTWDCHGWPFD